MSRTPLSSCLPPAEVHALPLPSPSACIEQVLAATILQMLLHTVRNALMRLLAALIVHVSVHIFLVICMRI